VFYEVMGPLLSQAAARLDAHVAPHLEDDYAKDQLALIVLVLGEFGGMWPALFRTLEAERRLYADALGESAEAEDPLAHMHELLQRLGDELTGLDGAEDEAGIARRARLREVLLEGAKLQTDLLETARQAMPAVTRV
jgi:hypothetical protein